MIRVLNEAARVDSDTIFKQFLIWFEHFVRLSQN